MYIKHGIINSLTLMVPSLIFTNKLWYRQIKLLRPGPVIPGGKLTVAYTETQEAGYHARSIVSTV